MLHHRGRRRLRRLAILRRPIYGYAALPTQEKNRPGAAAKAV